MSDAERLNEILECIGRLNGEIKSPAEELLQDALILVLRGVAQNSTLAGWEGLKVDIEERIAKAKEVLGTIGTAPKTRCSTGKNMYTPQGIEVAIKKYAKRRSLHGEKLHSYHCKECGCWHLTRQR